MPRLAYEPIIESRSRVEEETEVAVEDEVEVVADDVEGALPDGRRDV